MGEGLNIRIGAKDDSGPLPSMPISISLTQGKIRMMSKEGKGMWRKKPIRIWMPSSSQASLNVDSIWKMGSKGGWKQEKPDRVCGQHELVVMDPDNWRVLRSTRLVQSFLVDSPDGLHGRAGKDDVDLVVGLQKEPT